MTTWINSSEMGEQGHLPNWKSIGWTSDKPSICDLKLKWRYRVKYTLLRWFSISDRKWAIYRWFMRLAHKHGWHHMTELYPDGDTMLYCSWCGIRIVTKHKRPIGKYMGYTRPPLAETMENNPPR
jgi:hypothetical protein